MKTQNKIRQVFLASIFIFLFVPQVSSAPKRNAEPSGDFLVAREGNKSVFDMDIAGFHIGMEKAALLKVLTEGAWVGKLDPYRKINGLAGRYSRKRENGNEVVLLFVEPFNDKEVTTRIDYKRTFNANVTFDSEAIYNSVLKKYGSNPSINNKPKSKNKNASMYYADYGDYAGPKGLSKICADEIVARTGTMSMMARTPAGKATVAFLDNADESLITKHCPGALPKMQKGLDVIYSPDLSVAIVQSSVRLHSNWKQPWFLKMRQEKIDLALQKKKNKPAELD